MRLFKLHMQSPADSKLGSQPYNELLSSSTSSTKRHYSKLFSVATKALSDTEASGACTIYALPFELVTQIFDYALDPSQPLFMAVSLSQVSTEWRTIMLRSPLYWTSIVLDFDIYLYNLNRSPFYRRWTTKFWEELLARSGDLPLTVTVTGSLGGWKRGSSPPQKEFPRNSEAVLEAIAVHTSRWRDVYLRTTDPNEVYTKLDVMGVKFNNMRFLDMTCENNGRHQYNDICPSFLKRSPGLETAIIPSDVYLLRSDLHQGIYIPALRHLVFERQQIAAFSVITGLMPHLTSLKINQLTLSTPDSLSYAYIAFTSTPSLLRSLTINFIPREAEEILGQELTIQNLPRLDQLYLHCEECPQSSLFGPLNNNVQSSLFIQQLCRFFRGQNNAAMKAQCAGLKTLDIQSVVRSPNALHNFLLSLPPSLTSLDIGEAKKRHNDDGLSIFDRESFNLLSGQDGQVLPALKRLWISVDVVKLGRDKALVNMLKARCRSGCDVELDLERVQWLLQRKDSLDIQAKFISAEGPGQVVLMW